MDPDNISRHLNMVPRFSWKAGETYRTPDGRELPVRASTYWCSPVPHEPEMSLPEAIHNHLNDLEASAAFIDQLHSTGGSIEYFIGWFSGTNSGEIFEWPLLRRLGELRVSVSLDVYGEK